MKPGVEQVKGTRLGSRRQMAALRQDGHVLIHAVFPAPAAAGAEAGPHQHIQSFISRRRRHEAVDFTDDPLDGQASDAVKCLRHRLYQFFIGQEIKLPRKPAGPEQAQRVFLKPPPRVADRNQPFLADVLLPARIVVNMAVLIHSQGVDGKVAAQHVLAQRRGIPDLIGTVGVVAVGLAAKGCRFDRHAVDDKDDDAEALALYLRRMPAPGRCNGPYFLRPGRRRHVVVMRRSFHEQIPDGAADDIRFIPGFVQRLQHAAYDRFHSRRPLSISPVNLCIIPRLHLDE